jgi:hypothetical protein
MPIPVPMDMPKVEQPSIVIDGRADEAAWGEALSLGDFVTSRPKPGLSPTGQTQTRIMTSDRALYVHFRADNPQPETIRFGLGRRDSRRDDDFVGLLLDPLGNGERSVLFIVNPMGVQRDGTLVRGGDREIVPWRGGWSSWDTRWNSAAIRTSDGYEVELEIPWASIRHPESVDHAKAIVFRRTAANREMSTWPALDPGIQGVLVQATDLGGPGVLAKSRSLSIQPELTMTRTDAGAPDDRLGFEGIAPGLTMQYAPSAGLQLLATVNPDFSQVESDETKIDVNERYSLRYEEKRPFFLEGQEWFSHPMKDLIYTRTMVTPLYGARATSETGNVAMAALHVLDRQPAPSVSEGGGWTASTLKGKSSLATIGRMRWSLGKDNMVGAVVSDRTVMDSTLRHHLAGVDGRVSLTEAINLEGAVLGSSTSGDGQDGRLSPAAILRARANSRHVQSMLEARYISPGFRTENGFQPLADWVSVGNDTEVFIFPNIKAIPRIFMKPVKGDLVWTESGTLREYSYEPGIGLWTRGGGLMMLDAEVQGETFADQWFDTVSGSVMGGSAWTRWLRTWVRASAGEGVLYDPDNPSTGFEQALFFDLNLQPVPMISFGPTLGWERFTQAGTEIYDGTILRMKLELFATSRLWNRWIFERSTFDNGQSLETLFAWEHAPGRAVYLGGRTGVVEGTESSPSPTQGRREWTIFAKAAWDFD